MSKPKIFQKSLITIILMIWTGVVGYFLGLQQKSYPEPVQQPVDYEPRFSQMDEQMNHLVLAIGDDVDELATQISLKMDNLAAQISQNNQDLLSLRFQLEQAQTENQLLIEMVLSEVVKEDEHKDECNDEYNDEHKDEYENRHENEYKDERESVFVTTESSYIRYTVKSRDTVWGIAEWSKGARNILEQVNLIMEFNHIIYPKLLQPGQELLIPFCGCEWDRQL